MGFYRRSSWMSFLSWSDSKHTTSSVGKGLMIFCAMTHLDPHGAKRHAFKDPGEGGRGRDSAKSRHCGCPHPTARVATKCQSSSSSSSSSHSAPVVTAEDRPESTSSASSGPLVYNPLCDAYATAVMHGTLRRPSPGNTVNGGNVDRSPPK